MRAIVLICVLIGVGLALGAIMRVFMPAAPAGAPEGAAILYVFIGYVLYAVVKSKVTRSRLPADGSKPSIPVKRKKGDKAGPKISRRADILWLFLTAALALALIVVFALSGFSLGVITILVACGIAMAPYLLYQQFATKPVKRR